MRQRGLQCHHQQMQFCHRPHPRTLSSQAAGSRCKRYAHFSCLFSSMQRGEVSLSLLCFLFVFNGEEGFGPPCCVFCVFSMVRRGKTLLVMFSVFFFFFNS